jgi:hypothetical protein
LKTYQHLAFYGAAAIRPLQKGTEEEEGIVKTVHHNEIGRKATDQCCFVASSKNSRLL